MSNLDEDLQKFRNAQHTLVSKAHAELEKLLTGIDISTVEGKAVFAESYAAFTARWGDALAALGADWYEKIRSVAEPDDDGFTTVLPRGIESEFVAGDALKTIAQGEEYSFAWVSEQLWLKAESRLKNMAREAVRLNSRLDDKSTAYARVPSGAYTCAFCALLASRGWEYKTAKSAEFTRKGKKYHAHCDCQIVPAFGGKIPQIKGYDPDRLRADYIEARKELIEYGYKNNEIDEKLILEQMRLKPGRYKDSFALPNDPAERAAARARMTWEERQNYIGGARLGEPLDNHEIVFYEQFMDSGERFTLIPRPDRLEGGKLPSNDFIWHRADKDVEVELKSAESPSYKNVSRSVKKAVKGARKQGVTKDVIIAYTRKYKPKKNLLQALSKLNHRNPDLELKEFYWWDEENGLSKLI